MFTALVGEQFHRCAAGWLTTGHARIGQTRPVVVHRLVVSDTVEDRVLALQERKKNLADGSLGEGEGKKIGSE